MLTADVEERAQFLSKYCTEMLADSDFEWTAESISADTLVEVVRFAWEDLNRVALGMPRGGLHRAKFAAYHAYWFSRLQPVRSVFFPKSEKEIADPNFVPREVVDISERLAIHIAFSWVGVAQDAVAPEQWRICSMNHRCTSGACFKLAADRFLSSDNHLNYEYLVHQLRYQATEPTSLVSILEAIILASCRTPTAVQVAGPGTLGP
ncbi:MAG TPA: hypothetical protein VM915_13710 [Verrucomicrobiae bacterium]|jgi:hypothetical protein|nr:hypothetical protein [Verrucomicrobiae bacterium]